MKAIGFRAEKDAINWAVVEGKKESPVLVADGRIAAPQIGDEADSLSYFRQRVLAIIQLHRPAIAMVRYPETFGRRNRAIASMDSRLRVEGVILESVRSTATPVISGALKTISSRIGSDEPKAYLESSDLRGLHWPKKDINSREAILAAAAALEEGLDGSPRTDEVQTDQPNRSRTGEEL